MKDFFKYLTAGEDDKNWGLHLTVAGKAKINSRTIYPSTEHPTGYYFTWNSGRELNEYQINYITEGEGILENKTNSFQIRPGTLIIIRPGEWHRYKPLYSTGWVENYIGFNGTLAEHFLNQTLLQQSQPIIRCPLNEKLIDTYYKIFDLVLEEKIGFQQIASGMIIKLLGYIISLQKERHFTGKIIEQVIQKARFEMRENIEGKIDLVDLAREYNVGYSYFRKMFKKYVGVSPHHYHLELKIIRAKELILMTDKSIKEISFELGFQSIYYFSRLFKNKMGINPASLRK
jgi:AraC-like DNA-binding protein